MKTLILTEKPSVAADFAAALGATRQTGYYAVGDTIIAYAIGHLLELCDPEDYDPAYRKWTLEALPIIPAKFRYKPRATTTAQLKILTRILEEPSDRLIIATDAGREGELIARTILAHAKVTDLSRAFRFWSSEALTPEVIKRNLTQLKPAKDYEALYRAGMFRQLADWITGYNMSRLLSLKMDATFPFGRVQTALLTLLVRRHRAIVGFLPRDRYQLSVTATTKDQLAFSAFYTDGGMTLFPDRKALDELASDLARMPLPAIVQAVETKLIRTPPPQLYNLTTLQRQANKHLGLTADQTLAAAQNLYEAHKCLSYPRTPSRVLASSSVDLFTRIVDQLRPLFPDIFAPARPVDLRNRRIFDDAKLQDHHALIALAPPPDGLSTKERAVYDLVVKSMAVVLSPVSETEAKTVTLACVGRLFTATASRLVTPGWKAIYSQPKEQEPQDREDEDAPVTESIPPLSQGETVTITSPVIATKPTRPPKPHTEASALALMEKHNLGTEATRSGIIEKLIVDSYCIRRRRDLIPTDKAEHLIAAIESLDNPALSRFTTPEETELWENKLAADPATFYRDIKEFVQTNLLALKDIELARYQNRALGSCPLCGAPIRESAKSYYCSSYAQGCKFTIWKSIAHHTLTPADLQALLAGKPTKPVKLAKKTGEPFTACLVYNKATQTVAFVYEKPTTSRPRGKKEQGAKT